MVELQPVRYFDVGNGKQMEIPMTFAQCQMGQAQQAIAEWLSAHPAYELRGGWTCSKRPKKSEA